MMKKAQLVSELCIIFLLRETSPFCYDSIHVFFSQFPKLADRDSEIYSPQKYSSSKTNLL